MLEAGTIKLSEVNLLERNPRVHDLGAIYESFDEHGVLQPIVVNKPTNNCLAGNGRVKSLRQRKSDGNPPPENVEVNGSDWLIPCVYVNVPEQDEERVALALNYVQGDVGRLPEDNVLDYDLEVLTEVVTELAMDRKLRGTGWDEESVDNLVTFMQGDYEEPLDLGGEEKEKQEVACPECGTIFEVD